MPQSRPSLAFQFLGLPADRQIEYLYLDTAGQLGRRFLLSVGQQRFFWAVCGVVRQAGQVFLYFGVRALQGGLRVLLTGDENEDGVGSEPEYWDANKFQYDLG